VPRHAAGAGPLRPVPDPSTLLTTPTLHNYSGAAKGGGQRNLRWLVEPLASCSAIRSTGVLLKKQSSRLACEGSGSQKVRRECEKEMHGPPLGAPGSAGERREQL
jgi:hypothetical protein